MTGLSPEAKALMRQARAAFSPREDRVQAVRSALNAQIASAESGAPPSASPTSGVGARAVAAAGWGAGHLLGAALLMAAVGAGGALVWKRASRASAPHSSVLAPATTDSPTALLPLNPELDKGTPPSNATPPPAVPPLAFPAISPPPSPLVSPAASPVVLPTSALVTPTREPHSPRTAGKPGSKPESQLAPSSAVSAGGAPSPTAAAVSVAPAAPIAVVPMDSLAEEVPLLRDARAALDRGDALRALALLDAHERRFPRGTLYEERLATRVQALCVLGRIGAARLAAQELERAAPRSPHLSRVRSSCIVGTPSP